MTSLRSIYISVVTLLFFGNWKIFFFGSESRTENAQIDIALRAIVRTLVKAVRGAFPKEKVSFRQLLTCA